jgi:hypothetical protein
LSKLAVKGPAEVEGPGKIDGERSVPIGARVLFIDPAWKDDPCIVDED